MKDKIMFLIIGILIGGIITTAGFLIYYKIVNNNSNQLEIRQMNEDKREKRQENGKMEELPPISNQKGETLREIPSSLNNNI